MIPAVLVALLGVAAAQPLLGYGGLGYECRPLIISQPILHASLTDWATADWDTADWDTADSGWAASGWAAWAMVV